MAGLGCCNPSIPTRAENLLATNPPELRYIQIDDGYQPWMGDWLESGEFFGGDIQMVLREIRQRLIQPTGRAASFADERLMVGRTPAPGGRVSLPVQLERSTGRTHRGPAASGQLRLV